MSDIVDGLILGVLLASMGGGSIVTYTYFRESARGYLSHVKEMEKRGYQLRFELDEKNNAFYPEQKEMRY